MSEMPQVQSGYVYVAVTIFQFAVGESTAWNSRRVVKTVSHFYAISTHKGTRATTPLIYFLFQIYTVHFCIVFTNNQQMHILTVLLLH
jgi:hypothetical protein